MKALKPALITGAALLLASSWVAAAPVAAQAAGCKPSVSSYGPTIGYSHNGARIFTRTVSIYNSCSDTTWRLDIRPATGDRNVTLPSNRTTTTSISSSWGPPYIAGFIER